MAIFVGTYQEFHNHIGPRIRNLVNSFCRKERKARNGVCEECNKSNQILESAHITGKGRREIIERVLCAYENNGIINCDILLVEKKILEGHLPIEETFRFLCKECHYAYDKGITFASAKNEKESTNEERPTSEGQLEVIFNPKDQAAFKQALIKHKKAQVTLFMNDGTVEHKEWQANSFTMSSNLKGNLYSGYLRNWKKRGIKGASFSVPLT